MSVIGTSLGYFNSGVTAGIQVGPAGPRTLYGIVSTVTGGAVTIYDNTSAAGVILYTKSLAVGDVIHFGGLGIRAKNGLFLVVAAGTVNVIYS